MKAFAWVFTIVLVGAALAVAAWYFLVRVSPVSTGLTAEEAKLPPYVFNDAGIYFEYPRSYSFESYPLEDDTASWNSLMLVRTKEKQEAEANGASEGPVAITVGIFPNDTNLSIEEWVLQDTHSNYALANKQQLVPTTVGGKPAVSYTHSGLFESDAIAVANGGYIYLFEVGYADTKDTIRNDFQTLIKSVQFK